MKTANKIVMTVAGLFLIGASILKSHQLLTEPIVSKGFWESWAFFVIQIPLEMGLGIWLVSGLFRKAGWLLGFLSFGFFIGVTLYKGITGEASCGCFGRIHVNPWITLSAIDIPLFILLGIFRPVGEKLLPPPWPSAKHFFSVAIPTFIILPVLAAALVFYKPAEVTEEYEIVHPEKWAVGSEWLLLKHIDIAETINKGFAVVLMYHYDCPDCKEAIPYFEKINPDLAGNQITVAFVSIPPYGLPEEEPVPAETACLKGRLDESKEWIILTPLVVVLKDGSFIGYWQPKVPTFEEIIEKIASAG